MKVFYLFSFFIVIIKKPSLGKLKQGAKIDLNYLTQFAIGNIIGLIYKHKSFLATSDILKLE